MNSLPSPLCPKGHGVMILKRSNSVKNPGRLYYICPLQVRHDGFMIWSDEFHPAGSPPRRTASSSPDHNCGSSTNVGPSELPPYQGVQKTKSESLEAVSDPNVSQARRHEPSLHNHHWQIERGRVQVPIIHCYLLTHILVLFVGVWLGVTLSRFL